VSISQRPSARCRLLSQSSSSILPGPLPCKHFERYDVQLSHTSHLLGDAVLGLALLPRSAAHGVGCNVGEVARPGRGAQLVRLYVNRKEGGSNRTQKGERQEMQAPFRAFACTSPETGILQRSAVCLTLVGFCTFSRSLRSFAFCSARISSERVGLGFTIGLPAVGLGSLAVEAVARGGVAASIASFTSHPPPWLVPAAPPTAPPEAELSAVPPVSPALPLRLDRRCSSSRFASSATSVAAHTRAPPSPPRSPSPPSPMPLFLLLPLFVTSAARWLNQARHEAKKAASTAPVTTSDRRRTARSRSTGSANGAANGAALLAVACGPVDSPGIAGGIAGGPSGLVPCELSCELPYACTAALRWPSTPRRPSGPSGRPLPLLGIQMCASVRTGISRERGVASGGGTVDYKARCHCRESAGAEEQCGEINGALQSRVRGSTHLALSASARSALAWSARAGQ